MGCDGADVFSMCVCLCVGDGSFVFNCGQRSHSNRIQTGVAAIIRFAFSARDGAVT